MTKGRRAADRRREREGGNDFVDDDIGTTPGAVPASPHEDYEEVDDASRIDRSRVDRSASGLAEADARDVHESRSGERRRRVLVEEDPLDAEKSFAREFKKRPRDDTRTAARLEVTQVKEQKLRKPRRGGRLVVVAVDGKAPATPVELPIAVFPSLLGRSAQADLVLSDPTVSLRHAEIAWDDDPSAGGFSIVDLGSTSGTLVNGVALSGRTPLSHGDIIAVGKTELRFLRADAVPAARPVPEPPPPAPEPLPERTGAATRAAREAQQQEALRQAQELRLRVRRRAAGVIVACVVAFACVVAARSVFQSAFSDSAPAQIRLQVATLLAEAREHLLKGDVDAAHARTGALLALDPHNEEGLSLDRMVTTERTARDALQLALRLGDEDRDDEALGALARIPDASVFARDRDRLRTALAERALVRSLRIIENLLEQGRVDDALARAEAHLARFPDDEAGKDLLSRVKAAKQNAPRDPALAPARAAFAEGRIDDARRIAESAGYPGYVRDLDRFAKALADGKQALQRFDGAAARAPLDEAFRLLGSLGARPSSPLFATVQKPYADALYLSGTEKLEQGDGCGAARDLFKAARVMPDDGRIDGELQKLANRAEQGLTKARGARGEDPERARAIAREHLCYARSGSKLYDELAALAEERGGR